MSSHIFYFDQVYWESVDWRISLESYGRALETIQNNLGQYIFPQEIS